MKWISIFAGVLLVWVGMYFGYEAIKEILRISYKKGLRCEVVLNFINHLIKESIYKNVAHYVKNKRRIAKVENNYVFSYPFKKYSWIRPEWQKTFFILV